MDSQCKGIEEELVPQATMSYPSGFALDEGLRVGRAIDDAQQKGVVHLVLS